MDMFDMKKTNKLVTTFDGKQVPLIQCVKLRDGNYYEKGVTCFKISNLDNTIKDGRDWHWHRITSKLIAFDADNNKWDLIKRIQNRPNLVKGYYDNSMNLGYFTSDVHKTVYLRKNLTDSSFVPCINADVANALDYEDMMYDGFYYKKSELNKKELDRISKVKPKASYMFDGNLKLSAERAYGANDSNRAFVSILKHYNSNQNVVEITSHDSYLASFVREFTIGAEFETSSGFVPEKYCYKYGVMPLRDGSIGGYEYTTIPLFGDKGIATLRGLSKVLTKRTDIDYRCSFHLHLGGYEKTPESIIALYKLLCLIQKDVIDMFPIYKSDGPKYQGTDKNYCKALPQLELVNTLELVDKDDELDKKNIQAAVNEIFMFLTAPERSDHSIDWDRATPMGKIYNLKSTAHPLDPDNHAKWHVKARYYWVSLISFIFSSKQTVEFRLHSATNNFTKITNWLLICSAILKFAKKHQKELLSHKEFTFEDVLNVYGEKMGMDGMAMSEYLVKYYMDRKSYFKHCAKNGDYFGGEVENDKTYTFESKTKIDRYVKV